MFLCTVSRLSFLSLRLVVNHINTQLIRVFSASSDAPETENDEDIDVEENSNVTLSCKADGNPPPVFHWTYDDMNKSENTSDLFIERVRINETYKCTATNYLGSVTRLIRVHVTTTTNAPAAITPAPSGKTSPSSPPVSSTFVIVE